jgi:hypothetical protein
MIKRHITYFLYALRLTYKKLSSAPSSVEYYCWKRWRLFLEKKRPIKKSHYNVSCSYEWAKNPPVRLAHFDHLQQQRCESVCVVQEGGTRTLDLIFPVMYTCTRFCSFFQIFMSLFSKRQTRPEFTKIFLLNLKFPYIIGFLRISSCRQCRQKCTVSLFVFGKNASFHFGY